MFLNWTKLDVRCNKLVEDHCVGKLVIIILTILHRNIEWNSQAEQHYQL